MASGSSGRANSGWKASDFASDDILCSYNDFDNHESTNSSHSDSVTGTNSVKEFSKSRMARPFPANSYSQPEEYPSQDMVTVVENTMKKYTDNLMRFLEGISSRLSQLELYCYNLDKSIGEMRSDLLRDHGEAESKLKSLEKHLQEVHRSIQILRDKQELADTQKELAKIQLAQKESSTASHSQDSVDRTVTPTPDPKNNDHNTSDVHNQQLALALPHHVAPQSALSTRPVEQPHSAAPPSQALPQNVTQPQPQSYYLPQSQLPNPVSQTQSMQGQYMSFDPQYRTPVAPLSTQSQVTPQVHPFPQYQQQWPQQLPQQVQPSQQPSMQPQVRPPSTSVYSPYPPSQPTNQSPEPLPSSMPMQVPFPGNLQPIVSRADAMPYGYGGPGRTGQQQPPPHIKNSFGAQPGDGYTAAPHPALSSGNAYMMYDNSEGGRAHHPPQQPHFQQGGYPPQPNSGTNMMVRNSSQTQFMRNHPYNDLMEKMVSMGYRSDHVATVIQRLEESGQPVDFNAVLDRLNVHSSGGSQRGWSG